MTTQFKTKEQVKAEKAASQEVKSQDVATNSIPVIEGLEPSLEKLYALNRGEAHRLTQTVKVAAYKDEFQCAIAELEKGLVSPNFFENLQKSYSPVALNHVPTLLSIPSGVEPQVDIDTLCDRNEELLSLEASGNITPDEAAELAQIQKQLDELGLLK